MTTPENEFARGFFDEQQDVMVFLDALDGYESVFPECVDVAYGTAEVSEPDLAKHAAGCPFCLLTGAFDGRAGFSTAVMERALLDSFDDLLEEKRDYIKRVMADILSSPLDHGAAVRHVKETVSDMGATDAPARVRCLFLRLRADADVSAFESKYYKQIAQLLKDDRRSEVVDFQRLAGGSGVDGLSTAFTAWLSSALRARPSWLAAAELLILIDRDAVLFIQSRTGKAVGEAFLFAVLRYQHNPLFGDEGDDSQFAEQNGLRILKLPRGDQ